MSVYNKTLFTELQPVCPTMSNICHDPNSGFFKTYLSSGPGRVVEFSQNLDTKNTFYEKETMSVQANRSIVP